MNWFRNLFSKALGVASKAFSFVPVFTRYAFSDLTWDKIIREGYKANAAVSACATTLQLTFPEPPLLAGHKEDGRFIPDYGHPIMALLDQPNPDMGLAEFLQFAITYTPIGGNTYIWKQRSLNRNILALWPFSDAQVTPIAGHDTSEGFVSHYEFDAGNGQKIPIPKDDIIQWKWMIDPAQPWKGIGAIELCAREIDKDNEATSYIFALLKNNAVPPVVITLEDGDDSSQDEIDRMGAMWVQKHSRGQPAFISNGMKVDQMGFDLNKLAADTLADIPETRIAANFHVPPSVAGLNVGVKRSDYGDAAARKAFTEQTLMALWRSFASEMLNGLKHEYPGTAANFALQFDIRGVGALQEQMKDKWERVTLAFNRSLLTRGEAKQELGMKPVPSDDVYYVSLATEFVPANGDGVVERESSKSLTTKGTKVHEGKAKTGAGALQRIRIEVARRMTQAVDVYFSQLADRVVDRAGKAAPIGLRPLPPFSETAKIGEEKKLPNAGELLNGEDRKKLETLVKRFYVEILQLSWDQWNYVLGVEKVFDLTDPLVGQVLKLAAQNVKDIHDTTMQEIRDVLKYGNEQGWSIDQLVRGDENQTGLRSIVDETYKDRARTIARTELGDAQNSATVSRYKEAGVKVVEILDNGSTDDDAECQVANGQIWTLNYFNANRLEHPNCTRAAAPVFDDVKPDRG